LAGAPLAFWSDTWLLIIVLDEQFTATSNFGVLSAAGKAGKNFVLAAYFL